MELGIRGAAEEGEHSQTRGTPSAGARGSRLTRQQSRLVRFPPAAISTEQAEQSLRAEQTED